MNVPHEERYPLLLAIASAQSGPMTLDGMAKIFMAFMHAVSTDNFINPDGTPDFLLDADDVEGTLRAMQEDGPALMMSLFENDRKDLALRVTLVTRSMVEKLKRAQSPILQVSDLNDEIDPRKN